MGDSARGDDVLVAIQPLEQGFTEQCGTITGRDTYPPRRLQGTLRRVKPWGYSGRLRLIP
ncbi:MAG: hypothetical protein LZF62_140127 [Nitrospira sp.]|nr:MAG: hypothetical protein LZF62_140127 [Nitrospira sp.]